MLFHNSNVLVIKNKLCRESELNTKFFRWNIIFPKHGKCRLQVVFQTRSPKNNPLHVSTEKDLQTPQKINRKLNYELFYKSANIVCGFRFTHKLKRYIILPWKLPFSFAFSFAKQNLLNRNKVNETNLQPDQVFKLWKYLNTCKLKNVLFWGNRTQ